MPGPSQAGNAVATTLSAQSTMFDRDFVQNLKGETNAFVALSTQRTQDAHTGINRVIFEYATLSGDITQVSDGSIGAPEVQNQFTVGAQLGEWSNYSSFSAFSVFAALDDMPSNGAVELGYQAGQSLSLLYSAVLDAASAIDSNVNQSGLLAAPYLLDLNTTRSLKQQLVSISVPPQKKTGKYAMAVSPNVMGDLYNATAVNNSIADLWKYEKISEFDEVAGSDQMKVLDLPGTNLLIRQTPFVTKTANFYNGKTAYRSYVAGDDALLGIWARVPGDTNMGDGNWRVIRCKILNNIPESSFDPTGTIGALCSYRFHQVPTLPPATGVSNSQRVRYLDSVPAIQ